MIPCFTLKCSVIIFLSLQLLHVVNTSCFKMLARDLKA
jgi:hypothetical protein